MVQFDDAVASLRCQLLEAVRLFFEPLLHLRENWDGKRLFDFLYALLSLWVVSPLMLVIAVAIKLESHGPCFVCWRSVTKGGKEFPRLKFRVVALTETSMTPINSSDRFSHLVCHPSQLTRVGRFLRRSSLEELPQLFNILVGQMSVVGPRPRRVDALPPCMTELFLMLRPGMTGLWIISSLGQPPLSWPDEVRLDFEYAKRRSWSLDLWIMWRTMTLPILSSLSQRSRTKANKLAMKEEEARNAQAVTISQLLRLLVAGLFRAPALMGC